MRMQKKQFRIGQLAKQLNLERFVIRFWEKEFGISSTRSPGGQRFYTQEDVDLFCKIKTLLYEEGFTISGAKKHLSARSVKSTKVIASKLTDMKDFDQKSNAALQREIIHLRQQLVKLKELL